MILTKSEFKERFKFKNLSSVSNLLKEKTIVANKDGYIDLEHKKNKKWAKERDKKLKSEEKQKEEKEKIKAEQESQKYDLSFSILNQKFEESKKKNEILSLKLQKENKEVVETEVLNRVITTVFDSLFKNLADLPNKNADEILNIVEINKSPKEAIIVFLTEKILTNLKNAVDVAQKKAKKYYED